MGSPPGVPRFASVANGSRQVERVAAKVATAGQGSGLRVRERADSVVATGSDREIGT